MTTIIETVQDILEPLFSYIYPSFGTLNHSPGKELAHKFHFTNAFLKDYVESLLQVLRARSAITSDITAWSRLSEFRLGSSEKKRQGAVASLRSASLEELVKFTLNVNRRYDEAEAQRATDLVLKKLIGDVPAAAAPPPSPPLSVKSKAAVWPGAGSPSPRSPPRRRTVALDAIDETCEVENLALLHLPNISLSPTPNSPRSPAVSMSTAGAALSGKEGHLFASTPELQPAPDAFRARLSSTNPATRGGRRRAKAPGRWAASPRAPARRMSPRRAKARRPTEKQTVPQRHLRTFHLYSAHVTPPHGAASQRSPRRPRDVQSKALTTIEETRREILKSFVKLSEKAAPVDEMRRLLERPQLDTLLNDSRQAARMRLTLQENRNEIAELKARLGESEELRRQLQLDLNTQISKNVSLREKLKGAEEKIRTLEENFQRTQVQARIPSVPHEAPPADLRLPLLFERRQEIMEQELAQTRKENRNLRDEYHSLEKSHLHFAGVVAELQDRMSQLSPCATLRDAAQHKQEDCGPPEGALVQTTSPATDLSRRSEPEKPTEASLINSQNFDEDSWDQRSLVAAPTNEWNTSRQSPEKPSECSARASGYDSAPMPPLHMKPVCLSPKALSSSVDLSPET